MKAKWCVSIVVFIVTLLGVFNHNQIPEANQEVVLKFTQLKVSENETKQAIAVIKKQLQTIGAENIHVEAQASGSLKIVYYSETDAVIVKKILSEDTLVVEYASSQHEETPNQLPQKKETSAYNLDVYEIHKQQPESGFGGKSALEIKSDFNRFFTSNPIISNNFPTFKLLENSTNESLKFYETVALLIDNTSYKIPEVRAGPNC